ncbi:hypothetical protein CAEBREN_17079 [Caenorhabditis brenneri]|uniref:Uncharacterized protein n=1 Tax=Caenorhabditis brenneri TaxID=135651 RepID=G0P2M8_CAEBE|nr:hypothetical protein CAEBREN_17079 [Caenorhabditis brenneri]
MSSNEKVKRKQISKWFLRQSIENPPGFEQQNEIPNIQQEETTEIYYTFYAVFYALCSIRLITFSLFFWIGKYYLPSWMGGAVVFNFLVMSCLNVAYLRRPKVLDIFSYVFEGVYHGACHTYLSIPTEPIIWLTIIVSSIILKYIANKRPDENYALCLLALFSVPLLLHTLIGYLFGWLSYTYYLLSTAYSLASIIPLLIASPHFSIAPVLVPTLTIFSKCMAYRICGIVNESS